MAIYSSIVAIFLALTITTSLASFRKRETKTFQKAAVASDDSRCSKIGSDILEKKGGNSVDAAISTLLCLEMVNPHHSGISGGFFMNYYSKDTRKAYIIDAREYAPKNLPLDSVLPLSKGKAVGVPLAVLGFYKANSIFGILKWEELFEPIIKMCEEGYKVGESLAEALELHKADILKEETLKELFTKNGQVLKKDDILLRPVYAKTLKAIAKDYTTFYNGSVAASFINDVKAKGGVLDLEDLASARVTYKRPVEIPLDKTDYTLLTVPPPSSGPVMGFMLNVLAQFGISDNEVTNSQRFVETLKHGFAQRSYLGDDHYVDVKEIMGKLKSIDFAKSIAKSIKDDQTFPPEHYNPKELISPDAGTTHVSVVDEHGNVVAVTFTINNRFGAMFRSPTLDLVMNDEMNDFSSKDSAFNAIQPGKKPMSAMSPSVIVDKDGDAVLIIGAAGSRKILTSITFVAWNHLIRKKTLSESMSLPRVHHQLFPNEVDPEDNVPAEITNALKAIGHAFTSNQTMYSHVNAIGKNENGGLVAVSEPRMESGVAGN